MRTRTLALAIPVIALCIASCAGDSTSKKVLVMSSGKITVSGNTVTLQPGTTHNEETVMPEGDSIYVVSPSGNLSFALAQSGLYLLNLKKDTIVGSYQRTGTDNSQQVITQDDLFNRVDSMTSLMKGENVSEAARNYNIPPMGISRITANTSAEIIGPFRKLPGSFEAGKEHEICKFYTNKEMEEIVMKVKKMLAE